MLNVKSIWRILFNVLIIYFVFGIILWFWVGVEPVRNIWLM